MSRIIIILTIIIMLMPESEISVNTKFFSYNYSREKLFRRHKETFKSLIGRNNTI